MSLSFKESLQNNNESTEIIGEELVDVVGMDGENIEATPVMAYSMRSAAVLANLDNWTPITDKDYRFYNDEYTDTNYSSVDELKNIVLDSSQFNITQEKNSQYIPFQMPRYYDGFDLTKTKLSIYYVNKNKDSHSDIPVDVYYNDDYIRFAWLVSEFATKVAGILQFEIHADGVNSKGESYTWKTKSIDKLNVLQSLEDIAIGEIGLSEDEIKGWYNQIEYQSQLAQQAAANAQSFANQAASLVNSLRDGITDEVQTAVNNTVGDVVSDAISTELINYYTKAETYDRDTIDAKIEAAKPVGYATIDYVNEQIKSIDVTEQLGDYALKTDVTQMIAANPQDFATKQDVADAIAAEDITSKLGNYYTKEETYSKEEVEGLLDNVDVDLTGYATETYVNNKVDPLTEDIGKNADDIKDINDAITEINDTLGSIDKTPNAYYITTYNEPYTVEGTEYTGENTLVLYKTDETDSEGARTYVTAHEIKGGSGGGSATSANTLVAKRVTSSPYTVTSNDKVIIEYEFEGTNAAKEDIQLGYATWKLGNKTIISNQEISTSINMPDGKNSIDLTKYIGVGSNQKLTLIITDDVGSAPATTFWYVSVVDMKLESGFNDRRYYPANSPIDFTFTPYGAVDKTIHFVLDGKEIGTKTISQNNSGRSDSYSLPAQEHGAHLLEAYMTAEINGKTVGLEEIIDEESGEVIGYNHTIKVVKDIVWFDETSTIPIIGCATPIINAIQHNTVNIKYTVFDPSTETPEVVWSINGISANPEILTEKDKDGYYAYPYKASEAGTFVFVINCGEAEPKAIIVNVEELNIDVSPVTTNLAFDFNPASNTNKLWSSDGKVAMTVSNDFDWVNGGYKTDENGDQYFCVKAGTNAIINYNLFANDPKADGKEFKVVFRTKNIRRRDTSFLTCLDSGIGLDMKIENATVYNSLGSLKSDYCEDTIIEYEFNINKDTDMMIVMSYEDGAPSKPCEYTTLSSFKQSTAQPITIGSEDCDVFIYRMKAYSSSLTDTDIMDNFIADARSADEMLARYNRNQIYTNGNLISTSASGDFNVDALMKAAPDLRYIFLEVPQFTNDKDNKIDDCTVYFRYPNGTRPQDNWDCTGVRHRGQGTSSNLYGYAGRNIDLCMDRDESLFTYIDEEGNAVESSTITLTDASYPTDYLNIKVNIASSENANNAQLARRFNEYQPFLRYARKKDSRIKDTMEFYNCVVFIREISTDSSVPHREFNDTNWHFYAIGNIGDSKKTDDTRVNNKRDPKEHVIEITDADKPLSAFPTGKDGHAICPVNEWKSGNTAYDVLYSNEYVYDEEGAFESFGGKTYEFRYEMKDITDEQRQINIDTWRDLYTFIVTSTNEEFYANLKNYFVVDSALYYYLFTERYTMVDNRAKNSFWHYGKVYISNEEATTLGETESSYYIIDDEAAAINNGYRYDLTFGYDMDTALGIDNTGDYVFSYGKEDTDYYVDGDPSSDYVFRVADSVFFCRLRDLFPSEMQAMFKDREEKNAWDSNSLITQWDNAQAQFPEELWRLDYERKYYRTYLGLSIDNSIVPSGDEQRDETFLIGKFFGRKKYARRAFEINQEMYFATKYFGNKALSDVFWIRGNVPIGSEIKPNYSLTLVPYSDMYVCVQYTSTGTPIHKKVKAGETCVFENNDERMDFIYVYAASYIQEVEDLSRCYVGDNNFSNATRLQKLVIGSTDDGYENTFMTNVLVGNNPLLEHLDLRNVSGINTVIDVSGCSNLKELYAEGTNTTGVVFANGGLLHTAHLPNTMVSLSMKNLNYLYDEKLVVDGYDNLQTLVIENTPNINTYNIVNSAPQLNTVRLIGLDWDSTYQIQDASIFDRLFAMGGIDSSGHETDSNPETGFGGSVLTGNAYVTTIKEKQLLDYVLGENAAWSDLEIKYNTKINQYPVTFVNTDGTVLETQWVEEGKDAVDPTTRTDNPLSPTIPSKISHDFVFDGWDGSLTGVFEARTITATYTETLRTYTIRYVSKGITVYEETGLYGENVAYTGNIPTYTLEENAYKYYLFNRWDKSGFLLEGEDGNDFDKNGVKTVNAIFDEFRYTTGAFDGKELKDLKPIEIYALSKLTEPIDKEFGDYGMNIKTGDDYSFAMGYDIDFDDIKSTELISGKTIFDGTEGTIVDTGIKLFDEDKDFVLAIDYKMSSENSSGATLMQCFTTAGTNGFKLNYDSSPKFTWGSSALTPSSVDKREMLVVRHKKGDSNLYVYVSNLNDATTIKTEDFLTKETVPHNATLVFGAAKQDSGRFVNYGIGEINWCKIWYKDLGEDTCKQLAGWTHEKITLETSGFYRYQLHDDYTKESMMSLLATHLLSITRAWKSSGNTGGWANADLNTFLNNRFYNAIPYQIRALIKKVSVSSVAGNNSPDIVSSGCYITVPALYDVNDSPSINSTPNLTADQIKSAYRSEVYDANGTINFMIDKASRKRAFDGGDYYGYWLRSPAIGTWTNPYVWSVKADGDTNAINQPSNSLGILIEMSF